MVGPGSYDTPEPKVAGPKWTITPKEKSKSKRLTTAPGPGSYIVSPRMRISRPILKSKPDLEIIEIP